MDADEIQPKNELGQPIGPSLADWVSPIFPGHQDIKGRYGKLEPLNAEQHARALFDAFAHDVDGANWTYLPYGPFESYDAFLAWLTSMAAGKDPQFYTVIPTATGEPAGLASYLRIEPAMGCIEVGHLHFADSIKRSPVTTEAMFLMMQRAFEMGYRRYEWKCDALNAPSRKAAERLGLSYEGTFRQAFVYKGRTRDTAWFAIIDSEWPAAKAAFEEWLAPDNFDANGIQLTPLRVRRC